MQKLNALSLGASVSLLVLCVLLWTGALSPSPREPRLSPSLDPATRALAAEMLVERSPGAWDHHPDPLVGRVMQRESVKMFSGVECLTNSLGLRESRIEVPKPTGRLRVVLLGDSFVFGYGVEAEDRLGVFLQQWIATGAEHPPESLEVLHVGLSSWNIQAECAFLGRQLDLIEPDLVVHVVVPNDLDDNTGVRGFGAISSHSPSRPERASGTIRSDVPIHNFGHKSKNLLLFGQDQESRLRYEACTAAVAELALDLGHIGAEYLLLIKGPNWLPFAGPRFASVLEEHQLGFIDDSFDLEARYWVSESDHHWNAEGNSMVAMAVYHLLQSRGFLGELGLRNWPEAEQAAGTIHAPGVQRAFDPDERERLLRSHKPLSAVDFSSLDSEQASCLNGGVDVEGRCWPYVSITVGTEGRGVLRVSGERLGRTRLAGATTRVFLDEFELGSFELGGAEPIELELALPPELAARVAATLRFESSDFVYVDSSDQPCRSFRLLSFELD